MAKVAPNALVGSLSGRLGNAVLCRMDDGQVVVRQRVMPFDPATPAQRHIRELQRRARLAWSGLSMAEQLAWQVYAETLAQSTERGSLRADLLYRSLNVKRWQIDPGFPSLQTPPASVFLGDAVGVAVSAIAGGVRFTASGPNQPGVTTELLTAPVGSWLARPNLNAFRSRGFVEFAAGVLSRDVTLPKGKHACGVRFVLTATGQSSVVVRLGVVEAS